MIQPLIHTLDPTLIEILFKKLQIYVWCATNRKLTGTFDLNLDYLNTIFFYDKIHTFLPKTILNM